MRELPFVPGDWLDLRRPLLPVLWEPEGLGRMRSERFCPLQNWASSFVYHNFHIEFASRVASRS